MEEQPNAGRNQGSNVDKERKVPKQEEFPELEPRLEHKLVGGEGDEAARNMHETAGNQGKKLNRGESKEVEKLEELVKDQARNMNSVETGNQGRNKNMRVVDRMLRRPLEGNRNQERNMNMLKEREMLLLERHVDRKRK